MNKNILIPIIFVIGIIFTFVLSEKFFSVEKKLTNSEIKNCSKLNYRESLFLHPKNFSSIIFNSTPATAFPVDLNL